MRLQLTDCVIAFCVPLQRSDYIASIDRNEEFGLIKSQNISWGRYQREITQPFLKASCRWRKLGVTIVTETTLARLCEIFREHNPPVLIFISHAHGNYIELFDGLVHTDKVLQAIPNSYAGTIDLCVCHSLGLAIEIKEQRPHAIVKSSDNPAMYTVWFGIYSIVFSLMAKRSFEYYSDALDQALDAMRNKYWFRSKDGK